MTHKYYELLGVSQSSSKDEIKKAYKKLAIQMHPDKGGDPEKFKEVSNAYSVLSDDEKRAQYDQLGDEGFENNGGAPHMNPHDIFEQFFGGGGGGFPFGFNMHMGPMGPQKRNNHVHEMNISMDDAYHGIKKSVRVNLTKLCPKCKNTCHACQGKGHVMDMRRMGFLTQMMQRQCEACNGCGYVSKGKLGCVECTGTGTLKEDHKLDINIPAGVQSGHAIVFNGLGEQANGANEISGDLVFHIHVQNHPFFQRQGNDLVYTEKITLKESICGKDVKIRHFTGSIDFNSSDYGVVQPNKPYIIKGKGMPGGDLLVLFNVVYPTKKLSEDERETIEQAMSKASL